MHEVYEPNLWVGASLVTPGLGTQGRRKRRPYGESGALNRVAVTSAPTGACPVRMMNNTMIRMEPSRTRGSAGGFTLFF